MWVNECFIIVLATYQDDNFACQEALWWVYVWWLANGNDCQSHTSSLYCQEGPTFGEQWTHLEETQFHHAIQNQYVTSYERLWY